MRHDEGRKKSEIQVKNAELCCDCSTFGWDGVSM
jgi:hypothetical protein